LVLLKGLTKGKFTAEQLLILNDENSIDEVDRSLGQRFGDVKKPSCNCAGKFGALD
jgi:hypothetical protein